MMRFDGSNRKAKKGEVMKWRLLKDNGENNPNTGKKVTDLIYCLLKH